MKVNFKDMNSVREVVDLVLLSMTVIVVLVLFIMAGCAATNMTKQLDEQEQDQAVVEEYRYLIEIIAPGNVRSQVQCESYSIEKLPYTKRDSYRLFDKEGRQIAVLHVGKNYRVLINDLSLGTANGTKLMQSEVK